MTISTSKTALLLSYISVASISAAIITPALPNIEQTYSLTHGALEWVVSLFLLGYVVGQLIYGPLANRFGRLFALRSGLVVNLVGIVLCIIAGTFSSYSFLLIGRLITALGAASGLTCTFILINELLTEEKAKRAMSFAIVSFTIGIALSVTIGGLITQYLHWQDCFWVLLVHGTVMLILTWQFPETLKKQTPLHPKAILLAYMHALKSTRLIIFSATVGMLSAFAYGYSAAAPLYAQDVLHLSPSHYGYWNLINMLGMLGSGFLSAYLIRRVGAKSVLLIGFGFMLPCLISLGLISLTSEGNPYWFFITTMLLYLFSGLLFPAASYFASNAITDKASASSMMSFINMGTAMLSVIVLGYLPFSTITSFAVTISGFYVISGVLCLWELLADK